ncbi:MAG: hypothetical protein OEO79_09165 [Gemmatimonadota bacterium]|nr:hypothetical protein [Gemmatimonadota bacterium]MDH3423157.1 hypothetical protein [Gemmatimonadota bacterium]
MASWRRVLLVAALLSLPGTLARAQTEPSDTATAPDAVTESAHEYFFNKGRDFGTDAYAGPFDMIMNKGFAVAQWQGRDRAIFSFPYGWNAVWASVTRPGKAMERAGGWGTVLKRHLVPFNGDEVREAQWVPNYFGHLLEGGMAYRRLLEWNRHHNLPFSTLNALLVTQFAVVLNEAYETPAGDPFVEENGTAGLFIDVVIMDPLGMLLFHQDGVARFFSEKLGATIWPRQASITFPGGRVINNGEAVVIRPKLWFTDDFRFFVRTGIGAQVGISVPRDDGLEVGIGVGAESYDRQLDSAGVESAKFSVSAGLWIDRDGALLFSATWDEKTDRSFAIDVFPGVIRIAGTSIGAWFQFDRDYNPYVGITGRRTLGLGVGAGF